MLKTIFEKGKKGRTAFTLPAFSKAGNIDIPAEYLRKESPDLPETSELSIVRHYTSLSRRNVGVDNAFYPLGSCTMKYNPKINEDIAALNGFTGIHPYQHEETVQGAIRVLYEFQEFLKEISGFDAITLQPAAGAHGELTGLLMTKAYFKDKGEQRNKVLVPDTAHGTNPSSAHLAGFEVVQVASQDGNIDLDDLNRKLDGTVAIIMITNPNTLGLFEKDIKRISEMVHSKGSLLYMDGANLNAIMGKTRPGDFGVDIMHFNLHKTFSTPHGGGGPGSGPVGVKAFLKDYLPMPVAKKSGEKYTFDHSAAKSIGRVKAFFGNFNVILKAYAYVLSMGAEGLKKASEMAVLNANYMKEALKRFYPLAYDRICMHEFVLTASRFKQSGVRALDIAKRLLDYGFHPPTIYFPLIVEEAMMIEPTETEDKETLDEFISAMMNIRKEIDENPQLVKDAPIKTDVKRIDEVMASRNPRLKHEKP